MSAEWFLAWWNLIFIVPFLLALLYLGVYTASGLTFGEADVDADADMDADVDADVDAHLDADVDGHAHVDLDADHDVDVDAEVDGDVDAEADGHDHEHVEHAAADADHDAPFYWDVLFWLGFGRVPMSILLMILFLTWGGFGFLINATLQGVLPTDWMSVFAAVPLAGIGSGYVTHALARLVGKYMPSTETYVRKRADLIGNSGQAVYEITSKFGLAAVRDKRGDLYQLPCRVYGDLPPIQKGARVLLVDYDPSHELYWVTPYDVEVDRLPATFRKV